MTKPNDGGPAFPELYSEEACPEDCKCDKPSSGGIQTKGGMTLRDYFAAKAMQAALEPVFEEGYRVKRPAEQNADITVRAAYKIADAMIAERERGAAETEETRQITKGKFKRGNRVRVKSERSKIYDLTGVIVSVHPEGPGRTQPMCDIRLDSGKSKGELVWRFEDELEAVEEEGRDE